MNPTHDWHVGTDGMELMIRRDEEDTVGVHLGTEASDMPARESTVILTSRLLEMIDTVQPGAIAAYLAAQEPTDAEKDAAMDALGCELRVVENGQSTCDLHGGYATSDDVCEVVEVALSAARAARRDEEAS